MENSQTEQVKIETTDKTETKIDYESNDISNKETSDLIDIVGLFKTVSAAPTYTPTKVSDQVVMSNDGTNKKLHIFDAKNGEWQTYSQSSVVSQYQTTLTADNNTSVNRTAYTQTISGLSFAPHTVMFLGYHDVQTRLYTINGIALKNANSTTGANSYMWGSSSAAYSATKLGGIDSATTSYFSVSAWNSDGVKISKSLYGSWGTGNDKFEGILILIG